MPEKSVAMIFIAYTLSTDQAYPTQVRQGVVALNCFLEEKQSPPSEIMIGGDSAGGELLLLSYPTSHPLPDFPTVKNEGKLKAAILMSPWVSFYFDRPSFTSNEFQDIMTVTRLKAWSAEYKDGRPSNNYIEAAEASEEWWEEAQVEQVLCTAGGDEILLDSIKAWVEKYKSVNPETMTFVVGKDEAHNAPIVEPILMDATETEQGKAIKTWMKAQL